MQLRPPADLPNRHVYVDVDDVDALHAEWLGCGVWVLPAEVWSGVDEEARWRQDAGEPFVRITEAVEAKPWGVREFTILDPDNNQLRFGQETG